MSQKVIIIGGYASYPEKNWFPWLKSQLEARGVRVDVPQMPDSLHPQYDAWLAKVQQVASQADADTVLVGHSLGGCAALRFLETLPKHQRVGGLVLVATPVQPLPVEELRQLDPFFEQPFDWNAIKEKTNGHITAIYSANDHRVPLENGYIVKENLQPKYIEIPEGGHLNEKSGYTEFPALLNELVLLLG